MFHFYFRHFGDTFFIFHRIFSLIQLPSDPVNDLLFYYFIVLAENFIADETNSATVDPKENDAVCHFLRSVHVNVSFQARVENSISGLIYAHAINTKPMWDLFFVYSFSIPRGVIISKRSTEIIT